MATSYLDLNGLKHFWGKVEESFSPIDTKAEDIYAEGIGEVTESGNPVEIDVPYEQSPSFLSVSFEPIQDLNGYDRPWSNGGGDNLYNTDTTVEGLITDGGAISPNISWRTSDFIKLSNATEVTMTWESDMQYYQAKALFCDANKDPLVDGLISFTHDNAYSHTWQIPSDAVYVRFAFSVIINSVLYERRNIRVNLGFVDLGFSPYSNICPITGRTGMKVERCGKNLLPSYVGHTTYRGIEYVSDDYGRISVSGTAENLSYLIVNSVEVKSGVTYILNGCPSGGSNTSYRLDIRSFETPNQLDSELGNHYDSGNGATFTPVTTHKINIGIRIATNYVFPSTKIFTPMLRFASIEDSTYEPYTGETYDITFPLATEIGEDLAKNLTFESGYYDDNGVITSSGSTWIEQEYIPLEDGESCMFTITHDKDWDVRLRIHEYDENKAWLRQGYSQVLPMGENTIIWTPSNDAKYFRFSAPGYPDIDLRVASTSAINLGRTVYGGTLDMLSGVLTVDKAITNLWSQSIPYHWQRLDTSETGKYRFGNGFLGSVIKRPDSLGTIANAKCSALPVIAGDQPILNKTGIGVHTNGNIIVYAEIYATMTVEEFENAMSDVQFVYELATPITYQLDPHTILLLKGYNFISSDNDIKEITVKYQGESDSTIQNELSEHEEELRNISQSISSLTSYDIIADGSGETTISGNEISISDAIGGNAISLIANVSVQQITEEAETVPCGSETCVITSLEDPYSSVDIIVKNDINQTKNTVALGTTIGGGIIDIVNGSGVQSYEYQSAMVFTGKGAASQTDAYYIQTNLINIDIQNKCLCNIGVNNPNGLANGSITSPVYGYMASYPNLFFIAFPKSFGLNTIELANEFLTQIGGAQIFIPLATPTSFSFTPHNITLFSKNNIITGGRGTESLELTYESSTSSNVQIELNKQSVLLNNIINDIAPIEKSIAITNHSVGDYIILNGKFCKVTTAIATGEIITIGVNVSQTTISAEILAILSQQNN